MTVSARYGTGGNNVPFVVRMREGCDGGGKDPLIQEDKSGTLGCNNDQYLFQPKMYGICAKESNYMKSDNPHSGFYEATTSRTIDQNGGNPSCAQGGMAVVAYAIDRASFNCGKNAQYDICIEEEKNSSLVAKGPSAVCCNVAHEGEPYYIVRRLTPTECGRLQGFPDFWCENLEIAEPTKEDISFWNGVFKTFGKPKTEKQIRKWLANPHSDSAEYKMWGNGCALPNVYYVLFGIKHFAEEE